MPPLSTVTRAISAIGTSTGGSGTRVCFCTTAESGDAFMSVPRSDVPSVRSTRTLLPAGSRLDVVRHRGLVHGLGCGPAARFAAPTRTRSPS